MGKLSVLKNDRLIRAARGEEVDRPPVWVMRQAGRYLPEFRELRKETDFFTMCRTPKLACEVTLQPLRRFNIDGVIIFSDILVIPQALGMHVEMVPGKGPHFPEPLVEPKDLDKLNADVDVTKELSYVYEAISLTDKTLDGQVPVIGFTGAPWTNMGYMIEGGGSTTMSKAKAWLYKYPEASMKLLGILANTSVKYLVQQALAGARYLMVFDTNAWHLGPEQFKKFLLPHLAYVASETKKELKKLDLDVPMCVFSKGTPYALEWLNELEYDVIGLDWTVDPSLARQKVPTKVLQGNLDPCALYGSEELIKEKTTAMLNRFHPGSTCKGHIANLGHGMHPDMEPSHFGAFIDAVCSYQK